jgi:hypothetical protein
MTNRPIPIKLWSQKQLHRLYDDVTQLAIPLHMKEQLQRLQELEFEAEERDECPK